MYVMKLAPVFKELIWGGTRLKDEWGFETELGNIAEDWALTCHKQGKSAIVNGELSGKTLEEIVNDSPEVVGTNAEKFPYFPILIKLIDAKDNLSIQVHPENEYALKNEGEFGKTEMWYVVDCSDDAELIYGFKNKISKEEFAQSIQDNTLLDKLNVVKVKKGDVFFIEAGTVHAIGKNVLIAEIQQNSNTTYRIYDYNRLGADGKPRELHVKKASDVAVTEPAKYPIAPMGKTEIFDGYDMTLLAECELFTVKKYDVKSSVTIATDSTSFKSVLVIGGEGKIDGMPFKRGDSFFIPASFGDAKVEGECEIIVTNI